MKTPRVSVLMAAYNTAAYLEEAVRSVLAQTLPDFELIVIDDGSKDNTPDLLARLAAQDARIVAHRQANKGIGGATNTALDLARGEYVAILDSDDAMEPDRLALQTAYLDAHPDIVAVGSQWYTMDTQSRISGLDRHPLAPDTTRALMFAYFSMHHPTIMARKSAILAVGKYNALKRQGCRDYEVFANLALAGHQLANLPHPLMRWRLNPTGATHSSARPQTEDCIEIRSAAYERLSQIAPVEARNIAVQLVRAFPAGSWFDHKAAHLIPNAPPSPALVTWRALASQGELPDLEVRAVAWLNDEPAHADDLAQSLEQAQLPWLAKLVRARAGGALPDDVCLEIGGEAGASLALSLLIPTGGGDADLPDRVRSALAILPPDSEVVVFATDRHPVAEVPLPQDARLRSVACPARAQSAWSAALTSARGRHIAWLESGQRHHREFLTRAVAWLEHHAEDTLVYGPAERRYADVLDLQGQPVKDPAPEPRWHQMTLLGRDRASLGAMVHRRSALTGSPLVLEELGPETGWCMARHLLTKHAPTLLDLRNQELAPPIGLSNQIMAVLIHRLVGWYLDSGLGSVPAAYAWDAMAPGEGQTRLSALTDALSGQALCLHPGNTPTLLAFILRFKTIPLLDATFRNMLAHQPDAVLRGMPADRPVQTLLAKGWRAGYRVLRKFT